VSCVFSIAGHSGSGKTTLIEAMLPEFAAMGVRTSVIKQTHHDFEIEPSGKDSARLRAAGAFEVMVSSPFRYVIVRELRGEAAPGLQDQLARLDTCDLILVEGFHADPVPRLEVFRPSLGKPQRCHGDPNLVAIASDEPVDLGMPVWPLNEPATIALKICQHLGIAIRGIAES